MPHVEHATSIWWPLYHKDQISYEDVRRRILPKWGMVPKLNLTNQDKYFSLISPDARVFPHYEPRQDSSQTRDEDSSPTTDIY